MNLRPETAGDHGAVRELQRAAFAPSTFEAEIVDALRASHDHVPALCPVAEQEGELAGHGVGHVERARALALGPLAVAPARQNAGIGSALMHAVIERASATEFPLIALLGHPAYYPRFGFRPAAETFGITTKYEAPPEAWMALALPAYEPHLRGRFDYPDGFG